MGIKTYNKDTEVKQQDKWHSSKLDSCEDSALVGAEAGSVVQEARGTGIFYERLAPLVPPLGRHH